MRTSDQDRSHCGQLIEFQPRKSPDTSLQATTIAALVAVTILHDDSVSAEEKLLELIEQTGEAEILDLLDASEELEPHDSWQMSFTAANDN
jgi:hypothetical protein